MKPIDWKVRNLLQKSDTLCANHRGQLGDFEVIDIMFARASIFTRWNGWGLWPSVEQLCDFVCMVDYPDPEKVVAVVRYQRERGAVYRLYVEAT